MADEPATPEDKESKDAPEGATATGTPPDADADLLKGAENPDAVKRALSAERSRAKEAEDRAKAAEAKAKEYEDRDKSEQQKLEERASEAEKTATEAAQKLLRYEVAAAKKVPLELADRLRGEDKAAMEADADELLKLVKAEASTPDLDGGARATAGDPTDMDSLIRGSRR